MSCNQVTLASGKIISLCVNPRCENNHKPDLTIRRTPRLIEPLEEPFAPLYTPLKKETELEILKKELQSHRELMDGFAKYYNMKIAGYEKKIADLS